jgi:hypothetical protein
MIMNKIQLKEAAIRQIGPFIDVRKQVNQNNAGRAGTINNDDLVGLQNPENGKEEDHKKFKVVRHLESVTPGGTHKLRDVKPPKKAVIKSLDVSRLKNKEILKASTGGMGENPSTSRLQNVNS